MKTLSTVILIATHLDQVISLFNYDNGVKTIGEFVKRTEALAKEKYFNLPEDEDDNNPAFKLKGDLLEILGDIFFNIHSADPAVGLIDYQSIPIDEDYGVDGIGTNVNGDKVAVQMKYKANPLTKIEYKEIARTYMAGRLVHNLPLENNDTIFVFTTGNETTASLQKVAANKLRVIDRKIIAGYVDNNQNFWLQAEELIMDTLDTLNKNESH